VTVLALTLACGEASSPETPDTEAATDAAAAQEATTPRRDGPTEVEMVASMEGHYSVVILAHDALLQGDLEVFGAQLARVPEQELPASSPAHWRPFHAQLQAAASQGVNAADLDAAAEALAGVVLTCGTCHRALESGPIYPAPAPDDGSSPLETAMLDHQWATERLWEGVTGPWENAWQRGAESLAAIDIFGTEIPGLELSDELREREQALRDLGEEALVTTALDEQAALYGRLLATCGDCHDVLGIEFETPD
jgi:cytochrome c553